MEATWSIVALPPWPCYLPTLSASFQSPPSHSPSLLSDDFISFRLRALLRSPLRGLPISPGLKLFRSPVNPLSRSLNRDFMREHRYPRLCPRSQDHEGISFLPGMGPQSLLQSLTEFRPFGSHICPDVSETCCDAGEDLAVQDLAECLEVLKVPI